MAASEAAISTSKSLKTLFVRDVMTRDLLSINREPNRVIPSIETLLCCAAQAHWRVQVHENAAAR
jgi:hypothetical protein